MITLIIQYDDYDDYDNYDNTIIRLYDDQKNDNYNIDVVNKWLPVVAMGGRNTIVQADAEYHIIQSKGIC